MHRALGARVCAALIALTLIAAGCGGDEGESESQDTTATTGQATDENGEDEGEDEVPEPGGRLVVALEAESTGWLPGRDNLSGEGAVSRSIYDPLIVLSGDGDYAPFLAESIEPNDDLTEWTVTLRAGIVFHDGSPLDAETVAWNVETLHAVDGAATKGPLTSAGFTGIEVVGDLTVKYVLSGPNAAFPDLLRGPIGMPISRQAYESMGPDEYGASPVGTGPFALSQWSRDDKLIVVRNEDYWRTDEFGNQLPYLDEVEFRPIPDEDSRVQSLESDVVQVMQTLRGSAAKQVMALSEGGGFGSNVHVGNTSSMSLFNVLEPPVDDVRIRRAMALSQDNEAVAVVLGDDGLVDSYSSGGFFSFDSPWFSEEAATAYPGQTGPDPEAAAALVEEYRNDPDRSDGKAPGDPIEVVYSCLPDPSLTEVSQLVQQLWTDIGIEITLRQADQADHVTAVLGAADTSPPWRGDYQVACWRGGAGSGDPVSAFQSNFGPIETSAGNVTNLYDPEIIEQIEIMKTNADFATRYAAAERIGLIAAEQVPFAWSTATVSIVGWRSDVRGLVDWTLPDGRLGTGTPGAFMNFSQVWIAKS